jgi:hypothetical protein
MLGATTLSIMGLFTTLSISDTQQSDTQQSDTQQSDTQHK